METHEMMRNIYGDQCKSHTRYEWFKRYKDCQQSTHDETRLGQPLVSCNNAHVGQVHKIVHSNRLTVWEIAEECNISIGSCHDILKTKSEMHRPVSKLVPRLLTQDQRESPVAICQELLDRARMKTF
jgi:hypothetical protein